MRFVFAILLFASFLTTQAQNIWVMTYNIRYDNPEDGVNAWQNRKEKLGALIKKNKPDILGVQEALHHQLLDLLTELPEYTYVGVGRDDGKENGEYSAIFFRKDRFGLLDNKTFWLSETPEVAGSKSWDAALTRIATWARMYDTQTKQEFLVLNTHFDHMGAVAREKSAELIHDRVFKLSQGNPIFITGDFNCTNDEAPYQKMIQAGEDALYDATMGKHVGTFCGFKVGEIECKPIDFIFHSKQWVPITYKVINDNDGVHYPSDHLPVMAEFQLTKEK